jgi:GTPase Era involved in 16S rRNA processing
MSEAPVFVVVGHVNRGKSSVVSTLSADETVAIDDTPGTTLHCRAYPMRVDGEILYTLIDTPGFERARHVLAWLKKHEKSTAERRATLRRFVDEHSRSGEFDQECELLQPILDGGAILYVVDSSVPFSPSAEAETEILRWTGRPRMALLNPIGEADHSEAWKPVLDQYFSVVRRFDAHRADFERRVALLETMRELDDDWRPMLDRAVRLLRDDHRHTTRESAEAIADAIIEMQLHVESRRLEPEADVEAAKAPLAERYYEALRQRERKLRANLRALYAHQNLAVGESPLELAEAELFDLSTWSRLGLSRKQLTAGGSAAGAVVGGAIDLAAGGATFLLGSALGVAAGAVSAWWGFDRLADVEVLGGRMAGALLSIGPMKNIAFPWVLLGRALEFHRIVSTRAHAARSAVSEPSGPSEQSVSELPADVRKPLGDCFDRLRRRPGSWEREEIRRDLSQAMQGLLEWRPEDETGG